MQKTKLLVIAITHAAIIAAVTTTSLSAATPAFDLKIAIHKEQSEYSFYGLHNIVKMW